MTVWVEIEYSWLNDDGSITSNRIDLREHNDYDMVVPPMYSAESIIANWKAIYHFTSHGRITVHKVTMKESYHG